MDISVVVPLFNEAESLPDLYSWIVRVMKEHNFTYEIIFVNDGSTDESWNIIEKFSKEDTNVHGIKFRRNFMVLSFAETMVSRPHCFVASARRKEMLWSQWMLIFKIPQMSFPNCIG